MALTTAQKFKIKEGYTLLKVNAPAGFESALGLPDTVRTSSTSKSFQQIHWFVKNRAEMEKDLEKILPLVKEEVVCWVYYPKGSSKIQTDLTRDKGWDRLRAHKDFQWLSLVSFDDTWSAFAFRKGNKLQNAPDRAEKKPASDSFIDPVRKLVRLPEDLDSELKKHKKEAAFFESLAYSHKKEYVEWIISAEKEETRTKRIQSMIERLGQKWKNPSNN